jgi:OOP family OmpA-OmpF porin
MNMKALRSSVFMLLAPLVVSGCASMDMSSGLNRCGIIGSGIGGGTGAAVAESVAAGGAAGIVVGAVLGHMICGGPDSDGDGVVNDDDLCPGTPTGATVNAQGCSDTDKDGVKDDIDQCPGTPENLPVDENGCPQDSDQDGVGDYSDECPNTLPGVRVEANGCAKSGELLATMGDVNFDFNQTTIRKDAAFTLHKVVRAIKGTDTKISIEGHTDSVGDSGYNLFLSKRRATAVRDYLVSRGISSSNIVAVTGKGEASPIASNDTEEGRAKNRRVEIFVR